MAEPRHTIVLVQHSQDPKTRTFQDYDTVTSAMDGDPTPKPRCEARSRLRAMSLMPLDARVAGVCKMYEKKLKQLNPTVRQISYDIADLFRYPKNKTSRDQWRDSRDAQTQCTSLVWAACTCIVSD